MLVWYGISNFEPQSCEAQFGLINIPSYFYIQLSNQPCRAIFSSDLHELYFFFHLPVEF